MALKNFQRVQKNKRIEAKYLLVNLIIADILKVLVAFPMNVVSSLYSEWIFGKLGRSQ